MSLRLVQVVRDDWSRLSQCLVASLVGLHPALWFIGTQIDLERGAACDDDVVAHAREPRLRWIAAVAGGVALAVAVVGSDHIPPLVAFIDIQASAPSAPTHYQSRPVTLTPLFDAAPVVSGWAVVPT